MYIKVLLGKTQFLRVQTEGLGIYPRPCQETMTYLENQTAPEKDNCVSIVYHLFKDVMPSSWKLVYK